MTVTTAKAAAPPSAASVGRQSRAAAAATASPQRTSTAVSWATITRPSGVPKNGSSEGARTMARSVTMDVDTPTAASAQPAHSRVDPPAGSLPRHTNQQVQAPPRSTTRPAQSSQRPTTCVPVSQGEVLTNLPKGATLPMLATPTPKAYAPVT